MHDGFRHLEFLLSMIIVFCETCGLRISEAEIKDLRARRVDENLWICAACCAAPAPAPALELPPDEKPVLRNKETRSFTPSLRPKPSVPAKTTSRRNVLIPAIGGGTLLLLAVVFAFSRPTNVPQDHLTQETTGKGVDTVTSPKAKVATEQLPRNAGSPINERASHSQIMAERMRESQTSMENIRDQRAMTLLDEHKVWFGKNATNCFEFRERLQGIVSSYRSSPAAKEAEILLSELKFSEVKGRFVRLELSGAGRVLSLAEVQVISKSTNIAPKGKAKQSSDSNGGVAARAIDGTTNGNFISNSTTHTNASDNPWWEVELPEDTAIQAIVVWNRTDCCQERIKDLKISVLSADRGVVWSKTVNKIPNPKCVLEMN